MKSTLRTRLAKLATPALALLLGLSPAWSARPAWAGYPTAALDTLAPEDIDDLKAIQDQVKKVLKKVLPCTVAVRVGGAMGSGVIVSGGYVLTAGHVCGKPDQEVSIIFADGRTVKGRSLGSDRAMDSGLIKITTKGDWPSVEMGHSADLRKGQWCIAAGHPGGFRPGRTPVVRVGRILENLKTFLRTDCTLVGGDSGGPVFDLEGRVIGIHSCIGSKITANIHVPVDAYRQNWDRLVKGESWGKTPGSEPPAGRGRAYLGVEADPDADNCRLSHIVPGSPADEAGLQVGDVVFRFDGQNVSGIDDLARKVSRKKPGDRVKVKVLRGGEVVTLEVVLADRDE